MIRTATILVLLCVAAGRGAVEESDCSTRNAKVGVQEVQFVDHARQRPLSVRLWYPAVPAAEQASIIYAGMYAGCAAPGAGYLGGCARRPLILLSHGDRGGNTDQSWLAEYLAANGFIVAAVDHWQNTARNNVPAETVSVWHRPVDISFVLTALLSDAVWRSRIDPGRVGVAGHSSGGYTALALLGARYNLQRMRAYCSGPARGPDCDLARGVDFAAINSTDSGADFADERIKAAFVMAPALGQGIDRESLARITKPVHLVYAKDDEVLKPELNAAYDASAIPKAAVTVLDTGGHFAFLPECTPLGRRISTSIAFDICGRNTQADRAALHRQIAQAALRFFDRSLPAAGVPRL